ncbi:hypothetical protein, partial [Kaarinaea lacus]
MSTGILTSVVAKAVYEKALQEISPTTPYWRVLKRNGEQNLKYPGGIDSLVRRLKSEGHELVQKGRGFLVE